MYNDALAKINNTVKKADDSDLEAVVSKMKTKIEEEHLPSVMLVSNLYGKNTVLNAIMDICGDMSTVGDYIPEKDSPFYLDINYGETDCISMEDVLGECEYTKIKLKIKAENLKGININFWCGVELRELGGNVIEDVDMIILVTNATMALSQPEKVWMKDIVEPCFGGSRFAVTLYNMNLLNTVEDFESLCENVNEVVGSVNKEIEFFPNVSGLIPRILGLAENADEVSQKRQKVIIKNGLQQIAEGIQAQLALGNVDMTKLKANVEKVEKERRNVELAGRMTVESSVENHYASLRNQILDAVDQYSEDTYNSIRSRINTTKDVEGDVKNIQPYLEAIWKNFENKVSEKLVQEQSRISEELEQQIVVDCNSLVSLLNLSEDCTGIVDWIMPGVGQRFRFINYSEDSNNKGKMLSKGMLIASIALALVNPVLGLSAFVGTRFYQHYRDDGTEELRNKILDSLYDECEETKKKIVVQINTGIEDIKDNSKKNVGAVYSEIIESLMDSILKFVEKIDEIKKRCTVLEVMFNNELPAIEESIR